MPPWSKDTERRHHTPIESPVIESPVIEGEESAVEPRSQEELIDDLRFFTGQVYLLFKPIVMTFILVIWFTFTTVLTSPTNTA